MRTIAWTALLVALLAGCGSRRGDGSSIDDDGSPDGQDVGPNPWDGEDLREHPVEGGSWTILVYLVADNDLEPFGLFDLEEMLQVGGTDRFRIAVQVDRSAGYVDDVVPGLGDWSATKRFVISDGGATSVQDIGEAAMDTADALADFVAWGATTYPADRIALVLWDHGAGWSGFGLDETSGAGSILDLAEIAGGIGRGLDEAGVEDLSVLAFDACLMSTLEVAQAVSPHAEYLLASEELVPGHGLDYRSLAVLRDDPSLSPADLGRTLIDGFVAQAVEQGTDQDVTFSLVDLYRLRSVSSAVADLAEALTPRVAQLAPAIAAAHAGAVEFGRAPDPAMSSGLVDLGAFARALVANDAATGEASAVAQAIEAAVVHHRAGPLREGATGLSIYFPVHAGTYNAAYDSVGGGPWQQFLSAYFDAAGSIAPTFVEPDHQAQGSLDAGVLQVWGGLAPEGVASVTRATLTYGIVDTEAGLLVALGDRPAEVADGQVVGSWDSSALVARQGELVSFVYASLAPFDDAHAQLAIPMGYVEAGDTSLQYAVLQYLFDASGRVVGADTYLYGEGGAIGELVPAPGSGLVPLVQVTDASGATEWQVAFDGLFDAGQDLDFSPLALQSGLTVWVMLQVVDAAGQGDFVWLTATL